MDDWLQTSVFEDGEIVNGYETNYSQPPISAKQYYQISELWDELNERGPLPPKMINIEVSATQDEIASFLKQSYVPPIEQIPSDDEEYISDEDFDDLDFSLQSLQPSDYQEHESDDESEFDNIIYFDKIVPYKIVPIEVSRFPQFYTIQKNNKNRSN